MTSSPLSLADRADAQLGIVGDVEDDPAFVLAARIAACLGGRVVGMDLDRQPLGREQIFGHDVELAAGGGSNQISPTWRSRIDAEARIDPAPAPRLVDNLGGRA